MDYEITIIHHRSAHVLQPMPIKRHTGHDQPDIAVLGIGCTSPDVELPGLFSKVKNLPQKR